MTAAAKLFVSAAVVSLFALTVVQSADLFSPICPANGLPSQLLECVSDCRQQHNSSTGYCDENANCICNGLTWPNDTNIDRTCHYNFEILSLLDIDPPVCHCGSSATPGLEAMYRRICEMDCQCYHGAQSGMCDFGLRQCICNYPAGFTWVRDEDRAICYPEGLAAAGVCAAAATLSNTVPPGC